MKKTGCVILTTRGNYGKLKNLIKLINNIDVIVGGELLLKNRSSIDINRLIHNSQHVYFQYSGDHPYLMCKTIGEAIKEFSNYFYLTRPDYIILVGDRYETLGAAIAAYTLGIDIIHLEGGETAGGLDEAYRHSITKMASIHFTCTNHAKKVVENLGENINNIYNVGSTSLENLNDENLATDQDVIEFQTLHGSGSVINTQDDFLLVVQHPVTTEFNDTKRQIGETIKAINTIGMPTVWVSANMDSGKDIISAELRRYRDIHKPDFIHFFKSIPIKYYGRLLKNTRCIIGNSSSGVRESTFLGTPSINIGNRQVGRERGGNVIDINHNWLSITQCIQSQLSIGMYKPDYMYGDGNSSKRIVGILKERGMV